MYVVIVIIILEFTKIHITQSLIITVIYCYPTYALPSRHTARIHSVQNSALRFVFNLNMNLNLFLAVRTCLCISGGCTHVADGDVEQDTDMLHDS